YIYIDHISIILKIFFIFIMLLLIGLLPNNLRLC
ncbi:unnamed protein product, partial [Onchocerca ochengi]